jgi:transposase-like protein
MLPKSTKLRSSKYLNNLVEQDHRGIKSRTRPMLGLKNFNSAAITLAGVELLHTYPQGTVRTQSIPTQRSSCAGDLERRPCCINLISLQ